MPAIRAVPLTAAAFEPFGEVVRGGGGSGTVVNEGFGVRFPPVRSFDWSEPDARPALSIFRLTPRATPVRLQTLERHRHSSQTFLPIASGPFLAVAAPYAPDGKPDLGALRAFIANGREGFTWRRGIWHAGLIALEWPGDFAMLIWQGAAEETETMVLDQAITISL